MQDRLPLSATITGPHLLVSPACSKIDTGGVTKAELHQLILTAMTAMTALTAPTHHRRHRITSHGGGRDSLFAPHLMVLFSDRT